MQVVKSILLFLYYCLPFAAIYSCLKEDYFTTILEVVVFVIIFCIRRVWKRNRSTTTHATISTPGIKYEQQCAKYLLSHGYKNVQVTPASGDYGADIIATDKHHKKWVFQCKGYSGSVGNSAVQEVVAAKAHYHADHAAVITNSRLTANARKLATENNVTVMEGVER